VPHKFLVVIVKKLLKSLHIYRSYRQNKPGGPFFFGTPGTHRLAMEPKDLSSE